ncbi:MAG: hypothetical protein N2449_09665 [Bacteroidales bacterium]|nr:hypothetical protein [Bacteroidales bacterium]
MKSQSRKYILTVAATYYENTDNKIDGKLKISKDTVVFIASHKKSRLYKIEIPIHEITEIIKKSSYALIPNILILKTSQQTYKFTLYAREHFVRVLELCRE